jgi:hypothetical protein
MISFFFVTRNDAELAALHGVLATGLVYVVNFLSARLKGSGLSKMAETLCVLEKRFLNKRGLSQ